MKHKMELLAPAGSIETFEVAVDQGADAVYIGAPALNARALAKHFSYAEIAAMISFAHKNKVKVYVAMNSLLKEEEIPQAVETLSMLESLKADAIIIQDLGIYALAKQFFPHLRLHASTLLGGHNSLAVQQFARMGFKRVVLARETTLEEIRLLNKHADLELEVFIHGAMCFSYSGLCLFSSYLGGKSGLRGRCVQPCRRRYTWAGKGKGQRSGYFFSMNDLSGIDLLPQLEHAGVKSLKIEGRMRSASYVGAVVRAYRMVLDGPSADQERLGGAKEILQEAIMGRKAAPGFFRSAQPKAIISPQHSGNVGLFLGKLEAKKNGRVRLLLKVPVIVGDRLRLHQERSGERHAFRLKKMFRKGWVIKEAQQGERVEVEIPAQVTAGDSLYKVDVASRQTRSQKAKTMQPGRFQKKITTLLKSKRIEKIVKNLEQQTQGASRTRQPKRKQQQLKRGRRQAPPLQWWLRIDDLRTLQIHLPFLPDRVLVSLTPEALAQYNRMKKAIGRFRPKIIWTLPSVIREAEVSFYKDAVKRLQRSGFTAWQVGHVGQLPLFAKDQPAAKAKAGQSAAAPSIFGGYTLNVTNSVALRMLKDLGVQQSQVSIETDKENLKLLCQHKGHLVPGITVYGLPPLFTARAMTDFFQYERPFVSPKQETFVLRKKRDLTLAFADKPFSLLPFLSELAAMGLQYAVVDLTNMRLKKGEVPAIVKQLVGPSREKRFSTFNYKGILQ